ncbi:MAG: flagellar hook-basal body complex protein FliE [Proteobacteria bacterium]|nr:MAG: flagellar hook-basal body complex protein FliE [Pseudomonadota bacterium]
MKVDALDALSAAARLARKPDAQPAQPGGADFAAQLGELLRGADRDQKAAEHQATELAHERGDVVETMVALAKADLSLRTVAEVRNRALEAFHEILRLQV